MKNKFLLKATFKELFGNVLQIILLVSFFAVTFGVIYGNSSSNLRFMRTVEKTAIENNLYHNNINTSNIAIKKTFDNKIKASILNDLFQLNYSESFSLDQTEEQVIGFVNLYETGDPLNESWWNQNQSLFGNSLDIYLLTKAIELYQAQMSGTELEFAFSYQMSYYESSLFNSGPEFAYIRANDTEGTTTLSENRFQNKLSVNDKFVNQYNIVDGELPTKDNEIALNAGFAREKNYHVGDTVLINGGSKITGLIEFPNYIYPLISEAKPIVNMQNQGIVLMPSSSFLNSTFGLQNRESYAINFFVAYNDLYSLRNAYSTKAFNKTSKVAMERAQKFNQFLSTYFINPIDNFQPVTGWNDYLINFQNYRVSSSFSRIAFTRTFNLILLIIFLIIIFLILGMNLKKKISGSAKQLGTLKALGCSTNEIAMSYMTLPFAIVLLGAIFVIPIGAGINVAWQIITYGYYDLILGAIPFTFSMFVWIFILPLIVFSLFTFLITKIILRQSALDLLVGKTNNKPNFLVKWISLFTDRFKVNFAATYSLKNGFRSASKSFAIIFALFFSTLLITFALSLSSVFENTINQTYRNINYNQVTSYREGENMQLFYSQTDTFASEEYQLITIDFDEKYFDSINKNEALELFATNVLTNLQTKPILEKDLETNDYINYYLSLAQIQKLFPWILVLNYYFGDKVLLGPSTNNPDLDYAGVSLKDINNIFRVFFSKAFLSYFSSKIKAETLVLINPINLPSPEEYLPIISFDRLKIYVDTVFIDILNETKIYFNTTFYDEQAEDLVSQFNIENNGQNLTSMRVFDTVDALERSYSFVSPKNKSNVINALRAEKPNSDYVPIIASTYLAKRYEDVFDVGSMVEIVIPTNAFPSEIATGIFSTVNIRIKVVALYNSYIPLGIFSSLDFFQQYLRANMPLMLSKFDHFNYNNKYNHSNAYDQFNEKYLTIDSKIKYYGVEDSVNKKERFYLLNPEDKENAYSQPLLYMSPSLLSISSEGLVRETYSYVSQILDLIIGIFSLLTLVISLLLVLLLLKDIIDSAKGEVAMLKVLGFSNLKSEFLILIPYAFIIFFTFLIAIPFTIGFLKIIEQVIWNSLGLLVLLLPSPNQFAILLSILFLIIFLVFFVGYWVYKKTSPLLALD